MSLFQKSAKAPPEDDLVCTYEGNAVDGWTFHLYDGDALVRMVERSRPFDDTYTEQEAQTTCRNLLATERRRRATTATGEIRV